MASRLNQHTERYIMETMGQPLAHVVNELQRMKGANDRNPDKVQAIDEALGDLGRAVNDLSKEIARQVEGVAAGQGLRLDQLWNAQDKAGALINNNVTGMGRNPLSPEHARNAVRELSATTMPEAVIMGIVKPATEGNGQ